MIGVVNKTIDFTCIQHDVGVRLTQSHARWLRGAVIRRAGRPEFHQHNDEGLIYRHPLIRYDVSRGAAEIAVSAKGLCCSDPCLPSKRSR